MQAMGRVMDPSTEPVVIETHTVPPDAEGTRVDVFAALLFARLPSRSAARKALKRGDLRVNGEERRSGRFLYAGQVVTLSLDSRTPPRAYGRVLTLAHVDDHCAIVVKPPGMPTSGNQFKTLENALRSNLAVSPAVDALPWPKPVHRLDVRTGGLIVVARSASAMMNLSEQFQHRTVAKTYRALVVGRLQGAGTVDTPVDGRSAVTRWRALTHSRALTTDWLTTVECEPVTGRTHQIRRHLQSLGHPIMGDDLYGGRKVLRRKGLFLWSLSVALSHPVTGEPLAAQIAEPAKFESYRAREARRWERSMQPDGASGIHDAL